MSRSSPSNCSADRVVPRDRPWWGYPIGTKAPALGGGHWIKVKGGWMWFNGDIFPTPGADNTGKVILPPNAKLSHEESGKE